jgi:hypothetical protein
MALTTFMMILCLAGAAFCVRFLEVIPQPRERNHPVDRAAWERFGRGPFSDTSGTLGNTNRSEKGYF